MEEKLTLFAQGLTKANTGLCIVIVMSHGPKDGIYSKDGQLVEPFWIQEQFNNDKSPNLRGIPKFFIFQACR